MPQKNPADLLVNTCLFTKKDREVLFNHFSHYEFLTLQKFQKNSHFHSFSVQRLIFLIPNSLPLLYNATLLLPLCLNTQKMRKKTGFICARYPKWSKIYNFDPLPVLLALMGEPFLKRMAPNFLG